MKILGYTFWESAPPAPAANAAGAHAPAANTEMAVDRFALPAAPVARGKAGMALATTVGVVGVGALVAAPFTGGLSLVAAGGTATVLAVAYAWYWFTSTSQKTATNWRNQFDQLRRDHLLPSPGDQVLPDLLTVSNAYTKWLALENHAKIDKVLDYHTNVKAYLAGVMKEVQFGLPTPGSLAEKLGSGADLTRETAEMSYEQQQTIASADDYLFKKRIMTETLAHPGATRQQMIDASKAYYDCVLTDESDSTRTRLATQRADGALADQQRGPGPAPAPQAA